MKRRQEIRSNKKKSDEKRGKKRAHFPPVFSLLFRCGRKSQRKKKIACEKMEGGVEEKLVVHTQNLFFPFFPLFFFLFVFFFSLWFTFEISSC